MTIPDEVRKVVGWLRANSYPDDYIMHEKVMTACDLLEQQAHLLKLAVEHWEGEARPRIEALEREKLEAQIFPEAGRRIQELEEEIERLKSLLATANDKTSTTSVPYGD
jgi:hypothetical protein